MRISAGFTARCRTDVYSGSRQTLRSNGRRARIATKSSYKIKATPTTTTIATAATTTSARATGGCVQNSKKKRRKTFGKAKIKK